MRSFKSKVFYIFSGLICLALALFSLVQAGHRQVPEYSSSLQDRSETVEAVRRGGLREAARIKRHYVGFIRTSHWLKYDTEALVKNSEAVIIGTPTSGTSRLTPDGKQIITEYQIDITQVIKANSAFRESVIVSLPGGKVVFDDGSSAEIQTPHLKKMENGLVYLFFLSRDIESKQFVLTGGGQGLFELPRDNSGIRPHGHNADLVQRHKGQNVEKFLEEVKAIALKCPESSSCCN